MYGSIFGDFVGSIYEFSNIKTKDFPLVDASMEITDDSILTLATADWLLHGGDVASYYCEYANRYPNPMGGYGSGFNQWASRARRTGDFSPYNSCGNGSAMRVGPVGWAFDSKEETLRQARISAECTHNHREGIKGAQATALCIFMARNGADKELIRKTITDECGYDLSLSVDEIRPRYSWDGLDGRGDGGTCQGSVPESIRCFLDGESFEDSIRNAVSIGGDSDTIACITGSIAEAYFGVPPDLKDMVRSRIPDELYKVLCDFEEKFGQK